eukprot:9501725-Pyramimonas_sp.AAC.1
MASKCNGGATGSTPAPRRAKTNLLEILEAASSGEEREKESEKDSAMMGTAPPWFQEYEKTPG